MDCFRKDAKSSFYKYTKLKMSNIAIVCFAE